MVAIPGPDQWASSFALSLVGLVSDFTTPIQGYTTQRLRFFRKVGSLLPAMRQQLLEEAVKAECSHVFFVDSDQVFPSTALRRLLSHRVPVVACNIAIKKFPSGPTARAFAPEDPRGKVVYTTERSRGLERIWRVGTGVMLIDTSIIKHLGPKPWFNVRWREEAQEFEGEDWYFCSVVEKAGYHIYVDHELSWHVGHVGSLEYRHDFVVAAKVYEESSRVQDRVVEEDLRAIVPVVERKQEGGITDGTISGSGAVYLGASGSVGERAEAAG